MNPKERQVLTKFIKDWSELNHLTKPIKQKQMAELHETLYGKRLFEHDIPEIHKQLKRIADALQQPKYKKDEIEAIIDIVHRIEQIAFEKELTVAEYLNEQLNGKN